MSEVQPREVYSPEKQADLAGSLTAYVLRHRTKRLGSTILREPLKFTFDGRKGEQPRNFIYTEEIGPDVTEMMERLSWLEQDTHGVPWKRQEAANIRAHIDDPAFRKTSLRVRQGESEVTFASQKVQGEPDILTISVNTATVELQKSGDGWKVLRAERREGHKGATAALSPQEVEATLATASSAAIASEKPLDLAIAKAANSESRRRHSMDEQLSRAAHNRRRPNPQAESMLEERERHAQEQENLLESIINEESTTEASQMFLEAKQNAIAAFAAGLGKGAATPFVFAKDMLMNTLSKFDDLEDFFFSVLGIPLTAIAAIAIASTGIGIIFELIPFSLVWLGWAGYGDAKVLGSIAGGLMQTVSEWMSVGDRIIARRLHMDEN